MAPGFLRGAAPLSVVDFVAGELADGALPRTGGARDTHDGTLMRVSRGRVLARSSGERCSAAARALRASFAQSFRPQVPSRSCRARGAAVGNNSDAPGQPTKLLVTHELLSSSQTTGNLGPH